MAATTHGVAGLLGRIAAGSALQGCRVLLQNTLIFARILQEAVQWPHQNPEVSAPWGALPQGFV